MSRKIVFLAALGLSLLLAACSSSRENFVPGPEDKLTDAEKAALVTHARNFLERNKFIDKNEQTDRFIGEKRQRGLSKEERDCIKNTEPKILAKYTGCKEGELSISWQISESRRLALLLDGPFLASRQNWQVQITTTSAPTFNSEGVKLDGLGGGASQEKRQP